MENSCEFFLPELCNQALIFCPPWGPSSSVVKVMGPHDLMHPAYVVYNIQRMQKIRWTMQKMRKIMQKDHVCCI